MKTKFDVQLSEETKAFILSLNTSSQKKIAFTIQKSRMVNDPRIFKKLTKEIWEFRTRYEKQHIRLMAFWDPNNKSLVICSHGFIKKT